MQVASDSPWRLIYNLRARAIFYQFACAFFVVMVVFFLFRNASENLARQNIATGFLYLWREASFVISQSPIDYHPADTYARALLVGILNTVRVSALAVVFATVIGTLVGIGRLSSNPLLSRLMMVYVEILRNVPLLLLLFLCYAIIVSSLPPIREALKILPSVFLSNGGLMVPSIRWSEQLTWIAIALVTGALGSFYVARTMRNRRVVTGIERRIWPFVIMT